MGILNSDNLKGKTKDFIRSPNVHETEFRKFDIHLGFIHIPGLDDQGKNNFSISRSMYKLDLRVLSCIISTEATHFHGPYLSFFRICFGQLKIFHQIFMFKYWKLLFFLFKKSKPLPKWFYCLNVTGCGLWTLIQSFDYPTTPNGRKADFHF